MFQYNNSPIVIIFILMFLLPSFSQAQESTRVNNTRNNSKINRRSVLPNGTFLGCFETWLSDEVSNPYELHAFNVADCERNIVDIKNKLPNNTEVLVLIRQWHCVCTPRNRRHYGLHDLIHVKQENCDLECWLDPPGHCGGTLAYSAFSTLMSVPSPTVNENVFIQNESKDLTVAHELRLEREFRCASCHKSPSRLNSFCPHEEYEAEGSGSGIPEMPRQATSSYQYAFNNSPLNCVNYCRRYMEYFKDRDDLGWSWEANENFAILGFEYAAKLWEYEFPYYSFCSCFTHGRATLEVTYQRIQEIHCTDTCPGNNNFFCGGMNYRDNRLPVDTIYKIPGLEHKKDVLVQKSQVPPAAVGCEWKKCKDYDYYGTLWEGYPGTLVTNPCPSNNPPDQSATWECLPNGLFSDDGVNLQNCKNKWLSELDLEIPMNETLNIVNATDWLVRLKNKTHLAKESSNLDSQYFGYELETILQIIDRIFRNVTDGNYKSMENLTTWGIDIFDDLLTNLQPWSQLPSADRTFKATETLQKLEFVLVQLFAKSIKFENSSDPSDYPQFSYGDGNLLAIGVFAGIVDPDKNSISFCDNKTKTCDIRVPFEMINTNFNGTIIFTSGKIQSAYIQDKLPGNLNGISGEVAKQKVLNGPLLLFSLFDANNSQKVPPVSSQDEVISLSFEHDVIASGKSIKLKRRQHPGEIPKAVLNSSVCVFWHEKYLIWSTEGCYLVETSATTTECRCNHFTYFSILMSLHGYEAKEKALEIITIVLSSASALTLIVSVIVFFTETNPSQKAIVTKHLSVLLLLANISMLMIVDRNYLHLNDWLCSTAATLTMYLFLTAIALMGTEGWVAYQAIVRSFNGYTVTMWKLLAIAYVAPIPIIVATWVANFVLKADSIGGVEFCWLQGNYIWSFLIPAIVVLSGNTIIIGLVVRTAYQSQRKMSQLQLRVTELRLRLRGVLALSVIFGISWFLGFLILVPDSEASIAMAYLFTIMNASQGMLVSLFHCFIIKEHRDNLVKKMIPWKSKPTEMSPNPWKIPKVKIGKLRFRNKPTSEQTPTTEAAKSHNNVMA